MAERLHRLEVSGPPGGVLLDAPREMTITHTEAEIAILEKDGRLRILHPNGKNYRDGSGDSRTLARLVEGLGRGKPLTDEFRDCRGGFDVLSVIGCICGSQRALLP